MFSGASDIPLVLCFLEPQISREYLNCERAIYKLISCYCISLN
jgi:hypothetical protein